MSESSSAASLWEAYLTTHSRYARDDLVVFYSPLVKYVAGKLGSGLPTHIEQSDLVSYGMFGLIQAIERFDQKKGFKFETFAISRIRGSILDELRAIDWVPRSIRALAKKVEEAYGTLEFRLGSTPSDAQVASEIGITEVELAKVFSKISYTSVVTLDKVLPVLEGASGASFNNSDYGRSHPVSEFDRKESQMLLRQAISALGDKEKSVLTLYYYENLTMAEIGAIMSLSEGRVCQIHTKAVLQLKAKLNKSDWN